MDLAHIQLSSRVRIAQMFKSAVIQKNGSEARVMAQSACFSKAQSRAQPCDGARVGADPCRSWRPHDASGCGCPT